MRLADLGCGDEKLKSAIARRGLAIDYVGFDLAPQVAHIARLDIASDAIPAGFDIAALLGVLEYVADPVAALARLRQAIPLLVVSHVAPDTKPIAGATRRKLNWVTVLTKAEFEAALARAGYAIIESRLTPDRRTRVWLCRADAPQDAPRR
jgi:2-polyprenyl-3-methyl-5-hydroxy-6-metoxy-1,4-benzoquinol methylase